MRGDLVIIDDRQSPHGRRMARVVAAGTPVTWLLPTLTLPLDIAAMDAAVVVAVPLRVRGGSDGDLFTRDLANALHDLRARGGRVFVAQGRHPSPLAEAGTPVRDTPGPFGLTASSACVSAAEACFVSECRRAELRHG